MVPRFPAISNWLSRSGGHVFSAYCIAAAFGTYFCMYAFRKPFTAGTFEDITLWNVGYKTILVATQVSGYTLSKFIGIKVVTEMPAARRATGILVLIGIAEAALLLFAVMPQPWNFIWLFPNGLALGMVFGLVLGFLEGRQLTEALAAGLCASFIISSGVVKSVGRYLIDWNVPEHWMPFITGLLFVVPLVLCVGLLNQIPPPTKADVARRSPRSPMNREQRWSFFRRHAPGLSCLLGVYVLLTIMRSIRDDFAVEIWDDLATGPSPAVFAQSEALVMVGVVIINGAAIYIKSNRTALFSSLGLSLAGFILVLFSVLGYYRDWFGPFSFMVLVGLGTYIPYVAYHTTIFERLISSVRDAANLGYLMYLADALGYLGYVGVMVFRNLASTEINHLHLFLVSSLLVASVAIVAIGWVSWHLHGRVPHSVSEQPAADSG